MGRLDVKLELSDGRAWLIFLEKGDHGKDWKKGQGSIDPLEGVSYRVKLTTIDALAILAKSPCKVIM